MSYILSALKKSSAQRKRGEVPNVLTPDELPSSTVEATVQEQLPNKQYRVYVLAVGAAVLAFGIFFFLPIQQLQTPLGTSETVLLPKLPPSQTSSAPVAAQRQGTVTLPSSQAQPVEEPVLDQPSEPPSLAPTDLQEVEHAVSTEVLDYNQLPRAFRDSLPPIKLNGHFYSEVRPSLRKLIINNTTVRENQYISDGLLVRDIFSNGAILEYQGQGFRVYIDQIFNER